MRDQQIHWDRNLDPPEPLGCCQRCCGLLTPTDSHVCRDCGRED